MYQSPQIVKYIPTTTSSLVRKLSLIQLIYKKYRKIKDQITNKSIEYMLANDGILSGDLQPNSEAYLRQYTKILDQSAEAQSLLIENQLSIDQCLSIVDNMLNKLETGDLQSVSGFASSYEESENNNKEKQKVKKDQVQGDQSEKHAFYSSGTNFQQSLQKSETKSMTKNKREHKFNPQTTNYDRSISKTKSKSKSKFKDNEKYQYNQETYQKQASKSKPKAKANAKQKSKKVKQERKTQIKKTKNKQKKNQYQIQEEYQQESANFKQEYFFDDQLYTQKKLMIGGNSQISSEASLK